MIAAMKISLKQIVARRLLELNLPPIAAAQARGLERGFVYDLLFDKKQSVRADKLGAMAQAIHADPGALTEGRLVRVAAPGPVKELSAGSTNQDFQDYLNQLDELAIENGDDWWGKHDIEVTEDAFKGLKGRKSIIWPDWVRYTEQGKKSSFDPDEFDMDGLEDVLDYEQSVSMIDGRLAFDRKMPGGSPEIVARPGAGLGQNDDRAARITSNGIATGHPVVAEWVLPTSFVRHSLDAQPSEIVIMQVIGHSMIPIIQPNDRIMCDTSQATWVADAVYVIDDGDGIFQVKTIKKITSSFPARFKIVSEASPDEEVIRDATEFRIVGRVVGRFTRM